MSTPPPMPTLKPLKTLNRKFDARCHVCWNAVYTLWIDDCDPAGKCPFGHTVAHQCPDAVGRAQDTAGLIKVKKAGRHTMSHPNRAHIKDWASYVRRFRKRHRLTRKELAVLLPSTVRDIEDIEQGVYAPRPYLKRALRDLARELGPPNPNEVKQHGNGTT